MFSSLRRLIKAAMTDYEQRGREDWILEHCSQVVLTVSGMMWCRDITEILDGDGDLLEGMKGFEQKSISVWRNIFSFFFSSYWSVLC